MMQQILECIEPELAQYPSRLSISYLDGLILTQLDPKIYHRGYRLHKRAETPMSQILQKEPVDIADKMFTEIFDVMNELLTTMRVYYGYGGEDTISEAMYESIALFMEKHEGCFLAQQDRNSLTQDQPEPQQNK